MTILLTSITSCTTDNEVFINHEKLTLKKGISNTLTIQMLTVTSLDSNGIPKDYEVDESTRADFINNSSRELKKIYLFKPNSKCYWTFHLTEKSDTIPIKFDKGKWYIIWSNEFKEGLLSNIKYQFFVYVDTSENFQVYKSSVELSPI